MSAPSQPPPQNNDAAASVCDIRDLQGETTNVAPTGGGGGESATALLSSYALVNRELSEEKSLGGVDGDGGGRG